MNKNMILGATGLLFVVLFFAASKFYNQEQEQALNEETQENAEFIQRDYSVMMGPADAKVTIVEFFDPACGTCAAFYPFVKKLMQDNPGQVNLVLRYLPLHQDSDVVVSMLEAARLQDRFPEVLERTYQTRDAWIENHVAMPVELWLRLGGLGLDMEKLQADYQSEEVVRRVQQDLQDAKQLGVTRTPGFFVNGKPLVSFGYRQLQNLVESEIEAQYP